MSFKRLEPEDFLISTDAIVAGAFANGSSTNTGVTQANSGISADYYQAYSGDDGEVEYYVAEGDKAGTGDDIEKQVVYKQFANIITGESEADLPIGDTFKAIVIARSRYKQGIFAPTFEVEGVTVQTGSSDVSYGPAGRIFKSSDDALYLYPDIGVALKTAYTPTADDITCDSEEIITSNYVFVRARNAEFNYSQNPTFIDSGSGGVRFTDFITAPQTFITTVGLYNDTGDCLAVAKLSKPLKKDFTKEALIRIKLDF